MTDAAYISTDAEPGALSIDEFCVRFGVCRVTTYHELKTGRLSARKLGRRTLIDVASARAWFASLPNYAA